MKIKIPDLKRGASALFGVVIAKVPGALARIRDWVGSHIPVVVMTGIIVVVVLIAWGTYPYLASWLREDMKQLETAKQEVSEATQSAAGKEISPPELTEEERGKFRAALERIARSEPNPACWAWRDNTQPIFNGLLPEEIEFCRRRLIWTELQELEAELRTKAAPEAVGWNGDIGELHKSTAKAHIASTLDYLRYVYSGKPSCLEASEDRLTILAKAVEDMKRVGLKPEDFQTTDGDLRVMRITELSETVATLLPRWQEGQASKAGEAPSAEVLEVGARLKQLLQGPFTEGELYRLGITRAKLESIQAGS